MEEKMPNQNKPIILDSVKLSFKSEGEIRPLQAKKKKEGRKDFFFFLASRLVLWEILKEVLQKEGKLCKSEFHIYISNIVWEGMKSVGEQTVKLK